VILDRGFVANVNFLYIGSDIWSVGLLPYIE
jgi:hypothetical protein